MSQSSGSKMIRFFIIFSFSVVLHNLFLTDEFLFRQWLLKFNVSEVRAMNSLNGVIFLFSAAVLWATDGLELMAQKEIFRKRFFWPLIGFPVFIFILCFGEMKVPFIYIR